MGSLFELSDVHVMDHVTVRGPLCRYLLGALKPLRFFDIEYFMYHSISLLSALTGYEPSCSFY